MMNFWPRFLFPIILLGPGFRPGFFPGSPPTPTLPSMVIEVLEETTEINALAHGYNLSVTPFATRVDARTADATIKVPVEETEIVLR